nr:uncharacterized protein LOC132779599 [Anolis sagrei ordinatus]
MTFHWGRPGSEGDPREPGKRSGELSPEEPAQSVSLLPDPVAVELLKAKVQEAEDFTFLFRGMTLLLQEKKQLQASHKTEVACLKAEIQWLQQELQQQAQVPREVARLKAENQRLQQELQEAKRGQRTGHLPFRLPWSKTDFHIQVLVTGKTGNCEAQFLKKLSDHLSDHRINLKTEKYREVSGHFLLVFCPVASSVGSDMTNALKGLGSEPKAILVMLHHKLKESTSPVDTKKQAHHPAVVRTLHARYTLESGFYTCPMNEEAVAVVAEVLKDHC